MTKPKRPSLQLADLIVRHTEALLASWRASMRKLLVARNLSNPVLNDHMLQLLKVLASELRLESGDPLIDDSGGFAVSDIPVTHGLDRLNLGFDL